MKRAALYTRVSTSDQHRKPNCSTCAKWLLSVATKSLENTAT